MNLCSFAFSMFFLLSFRTLLIFLLFPLLLLLPFPFGIFARLRVVGDTFEEVEESDDGMTIVPRLSRLRRREERRTYRLPWKGSHLTYGESKSLGLLLKGGERTLAEVFMATDNLALPCVATTIPFPSSSSSLGVLWSFFGILPKPSSISPSSSFPSPPPLSPFSFSSPLNKKKQCDAKNKEENNVFFGKTQNFW